MNELFFSVYDRDCSWRTLILTWLLSIVFLSVFWKVMPHHCAVPGCTSNGKTSPFVSFHKFPTDKDHRSSWVKNIM